MDAVAAYFHLDAIPGCLILFWQTLTWVDDLIPIIHLCVCVRAQSVNVSGDRLSNPTAVTDS